MTIVDARLFADPYTMNSADVIELFAYLCSIEMIIKKQQVRVLERMHRLSETDPQLRDLVCRFHQLDQDDSNF